MGPKLLLSWQKWDLSDEGRWAPAGNRGSPGCFRVEVPGYMV